MDLNLVNNYISSLLAKPFVIITGSSGTGKTRLAIQLSEALAREEAPNEVEIVLDRNGRITNLTEDEVRDLCSNTNQFTAALIDGREGENERNLQITIEMSMYVESQDETFNFLQNFNDPIRLRIISESRSILNRYEHVPVGADWTDVTHLIGYVNFFGPEGHRVYEITPTLKLILRAIHEQNRNIPHFLILDEMNLSHVERYFSTFLSIMEANRSTQSSNGIPLIDRENVQLILETLTGDFNPREELRLEIETLQQLVNNESPIYLPNNLFIVGTVNIDETTYMFSPKVLDRAHVIELEPSEPSTYFADNTSGNISFDVPTRNRIMTKFEESIQRRRNQNTSGLVFLRQKIVENNHDTELIINSTQRVLNGIYKLLKPINFGFGYRTINEVVEYLAVREDFIVGNEWEQSLDRAILQKVLPKLHGNRRQLTDCLNALVTFFNGEEARYMWGEETILVEATGIILGECKNKVSEMLKVLDYSGYTSFIS